MPRWVPQDVVSSITPASRRRTEYLSPLMDQVREHVRGYIDQHPSAHDVTLEILARLGDSLHAYEPQKSRKRLNQDVGLLVAQTLVDLYGPHRVLTLRADDGHDVATRRNTRPGLRFVERYTPHQILPEGKLPVLRIILDTNVVRSFLQEDASAFDPVKVAHLKGDHPISIADGAFAELVRALSEERMPVEKWTHRVDALDQILDRDLPITPGGADLTAMAGLSRMHGVDMQELHAIYRQAWERLRTCRTSMDIRNLSFTVEKADGQRKPVPLASLLDDTGKKWDGVMASLGSLLAGKNQDMDEVTDFIGQNLLLELKEEAKAKLDLPIRALAKRAMQFADNPASRGSNDAIDFELLFTIALPGVVCTADISLIQLVQETGSGDAWRVMEPPQLVHWLAEVQYGQSRVPLDENLLRGDEQKAAWDAWAAAGPQGPITDDDDKAGWS